MRKARKSTTRAVKLRSRRKRARRAVASPAQIVSGGNPTRADLLDMTMRTRQSAPALKVQAAAAPSAPNASASMDRIVRYGRISARCNRAVERARPIA